MATGLDALTRALRMLTVLDTEESATAIQGTNGKDAINQMLARWEEDGIALGFVTLTAIGDTLNVPDANLGGIVANLAVELAPEYGAAVPPSVAMMASNGYASAQRDAIKHNVSPRHMDYLPGSGHSFNINTGD